MHYQVIHHDKETVARAGILTTAHGVMETPIFMPVGTGATVKGMTPRQLEELHVQILLGNTYHLFLRPGHALIRTLGGLHRFMGWTGPILTDSGGFQVFSQSSLRKVTEAGVTFRSYVDGATCFLGPEESIEVQEALGADIIMAFDECPSLPAERPQILAAMERTTRWLERCIKARRRSDQALFGILQGGTDRDLRRQHLEQIVPFALPGYAIGGLSVGEGPALLQEVVAEIAPLLPEDRPRYLMGVGRPEDLVAGVCSGVDMFDCVMPTRHARNAQVFTHTGRRVLRNARYRDADAPIDDQCSCYTCRHFSLAYLRHLFTAKGMLGPILATLHNLHYYLQLMRDLRQAILADRLSSFCHDFYHQRTAEPQDPEPDETSA